MSQIASPSSQAPIATTVTGSPFHDAIHEFASQFGKKRPPSFLKEFNAGNHIYDTQVQLVMVDMSERKYNTRAKRIINSIIEVMRDYSNILNTLSQADPMPSALIWSSLKTGIDCLGRHKDLQTHMQTHLTRLTDQMQRLSDYRELFGQSSAMQEYLKNSYLNILRFWAKVDEQCNRPSFVQAMRSLASFDLKKLDVILDDMKMDEDNIAKLVPTVQERIRRGEHEDATEERRKALDTISMWIDEQRELHKRVDEEKRTRRKREALQWFRGSSTLNERNYRRQRDGESVLLDDTYSWLMNDHTFEGWMDSYSQQRTIWLKGDPGTGKSVTCSFAVKALRGRVPSAAIAYHYYNFDEQVSSATVYRNLIEQLWDQLYTQKDDVSDSIYNIISSQSDNVLTLYELLRLIISELASTYILIDGLDEECGPDQERWREAKDVLNGLTNLTKDTSSLVKLWCSSQDRRCVHDYLTSFPTVTLDAAKNSVGIATFFEDMMPSLKDSELDPGTKALLLQDLQSRASGNFLWANLMVDSVSDAISPSDLQRRVQEGLPERIEEYYAQKVGRIAGQQRQIVSRILSCIVHAKRPLIVEELCEATGIFSVKWGENLSPGHPLFRERIVELCAPLVKVQELGEASSKNVCTLTHSSVRDFLLKNPEILNGPLSYDTQDAISPEVLAWATLKYLFQPRYKRLLRMNEAKSTFVTADGEDVMDQHLLSYAAKYWDKHLDALEGNDTLFKHVEQFVRSKQFITTIQVQCLFIEGLFSFWISATQPWVGLNLRRTFPHWFSSQHENGKVLSKQYYHAIGEWGSFLNEYASATGRFPGQLDHCLWRTLPPGNFLRNFPSQHKSFNFAERGGCPQVGLCRFWDSVDGACDRLQVFRLEKLDEEQKLVKIVCQTWEMQAGHSPKLRKDQAFSVPTQSLDIYERPLTVNIQGRPIPITSSTDQKFLRIASQIFMASEDGNYQEMTDLPHNDQYFEEVASRERYLAIARRRTITSNEVQSSGLADDVVLDFGKIYATMVDTFASASSTPDQASRESWRAGSSNASPASSRTSLSLMAESTSEDNASVKVEDDLLSSDWSSDSDGWSSESMSARESWSEGSTEPHSDETEDEDQWNDYASDDAELNILDSLSQASAHSLKLSDEEAEHESSESDTEDRPVDQSTIADGSKEDEEASSVHLSSAATSDRSSMGHYASADNSSTASFSSRDFTEDSDSDADANADGGAVALDALLGRGHRSTKASAKHERGQLVIYDTSRSNSQPIFRFDYPCHDVLLDSPPIFHPLKDLVVWPLGGREILFADFRQKTYYTRYLRCSSPRSCHVFIQGRFSVCGTYLHLAALEARLETEENSLSCTLQVSTHRLSAGKTTRSPPRLIHRIAVPLGDATTFSSGRMPYNLTWSAEYIYATASTTQLRVTRVPLFRKRGDKTQQSHVLSCSVFFPVSASERNIRFFPPRPGAKAQNQATVIIGSHSPLPMGGMLIPRHTISPPIGCFVDLEKDNVAWEPIEEKQSQEGDQRQIRMGGQLQAKFEKFDRTDDCDIVPYIF
ncbi:MAG: hypothetical protein M1822_005983 [Bathelium mastoideum]|nr:MAG: hypothetical protein M1822_005983 [Bathelium mastoideum]